MTTSAMSPQVPRTSIGLTVLRVAIGIIFLVHGSQKLFVFGFGGVTGAFAQMHVPLPGISGPVIACIEFLGGVALILGIFSRVAALLVALDMLGAILLVHLRNGFFNPMGFEFPLALFAGTIAIALSGPGAFALDNIFGSKRLS